VRQAGANSRIASPAARAAITIRAIHCRCGQLCGQVGCVGPKAANFLHLRWFAQSLSIKKVFRINDLLQYDVAVTGASARQASIGAVVEFWARAVAGFAWR